VIAARLSLAAALLLAAGAHAQEPRVAGKIEFAEGIARIDGKDQRTRRPVVGASVYEGDTIATSGQSELHLDMADGASLIVRENSKVTLTEYVAEGGGGDRSLIDLAQGALRSITGWIGQYNRNNYRVRTPLVTIGVRGTDHEPTHLLTGDPRGEPGSYDKVNDGSAFMETKQGIVEVPKNKAAFHAISGKSSPRLLGAVPAFFKPGRHEQRFLARAQEVRKAIPQRRMERQEFVRQRGPASAPKAAPIPHKPPAKDAAAQMRQPDRAVRDKAKDARGSEKKSRRPGEAKGLRPDERKH
jgi:hypothetical protein